MSICRSEGLDEIGGFVSVDGESLIEQVNAAVREIEKRRAAKREQGIRVWMKEWNRSVKRWRWLWTWREIGMDEAESKLKALHGGPSVIASLDAMWILFPIVAGERDVMEHANDLLRCAKHRPRVYVRANLYADICRWAEVSETP